jgi:hypothetical protein
MAFPFLTNEFFFLVFHGKEKLEREIANGRGFPLPTCI